MEISFNFSLLESIKSFATNEMKNLDAIKKERKVSDDTSSAMIFTNIQKAVVANGTKMVPKVKGIILFKITHPDANWTVDLMNNNGSVYQGLPKGGMADLTVSIKEKDLILMQQGKLTPQKAFMNQLLKLKGNISLALKLKPILAAGGPPISKL